MGGSLPLKLEGEVKTGGTPSQVGLLGGMWFFFLPFLPPSVTQRSEPLDRIIDVFIVFENITTNNIRCKKIKKTWLC